MKKIKNTGQSKYMIFDPVSGSLQINNPHADISSHTIKKGVIYTRVSTEEQKRDGSGLIGQKISCEQWAKSNDIEVVGYYTDEAITGQNLGRKGFTDAISFLEKQNKNEVKVDYFICGSTSRFSRSHDLGKTFETLSRVQSTGAQLVAVGNGGIQETDSEEGILTTSLSFMIDAIESKRGQKRVRAGQKGKIYEGLRPFPDIPLGYERVSQKVGDKNMKFLIRKEPTASILSEGLKMFAEGVLLTKQHLHEYLDEHGIKSNSKKNKTGKLHYSIIGKLLDPRKLLVYTGNLTYPDWGINEIIPAKHPALIDIDIMNKILNRLSINGKIANHKKRAYDDDADEYPLKRILLCPRCDKTVTKWKSKSKTGDYHHYYGCNEKSCSLFKKALPRKQVHDAIRDRLRELQPPQGFMKLFEYNFKEVRNTMSKESNYTNQNKTDKLKMTIEEMDRIEQALDNITDQALFRKKQQRRADLNEEKQLLEIEIAHVRFSQDEFDKVYNDAKTIIANPIAIWDLDDVEIKQLLIGVCFNNKIYYTKKEGLHTPQISLIYGYIRSLSEDENLKVEMMGVEPMSK